MIAFDQAESEVNWAVLSEIGQAFGAVSALISAVALLGITRSLRLQRQQTDVAQFQAVRGLRTQLLQLALKEPRFLAPWGITITNDDQEAQEWAYNSLVFAYLKMAFAVGLLGAFELETSARAAFQQPSVRTFWERARDVYLVDATNDRARRFAELIENAYTSTATPEMQPTPANNGPIKQSGHTLHNPVNKVTWVAVMCCGAAGVVWARRAWKRRRGSETG